MYGWKEAEKEFCRGDTDGKERAELDEWRNKFNESLKKALDGLTEQQAQVIRLCYMDGMTAKQAAKKTGLTEKQIVANRRAALYRLAKSTYLLDYYLPDYSEKSQEVLERELDESLKTVLARRERQRRKLAKEQAEERQRRRIAERAERKRRFEKSEEYQRAQAAANALDSRKPSTYAERQAAIYEQYHKFIARENKQPYSQSKEE